MTCFSLWCKLFHLFVLLTSSLSSVPGLHYVKEKGSKFAVGCSFKSTTQNTLWQVRSGNVYINASNCTFGTNICVDYLPQQFRGEVLSTLDGFASYLTINSVNIDETEFRCSYQYGFVSNTAEIYTRPSKPVCDPVELDYTKKNLQFTCRVNDVYPSVGAMLYIRGVTLSMQDLLASHCSNEENSSLTPGGYSAVCEWRVSTAKLEPIIYRYYVKMYPEVSNTTGIPMTASQDFTLQLSSPVSVIDYEHCPVGAGGRYDKAITGSSASCRCVLESPGFPTGQARWYTQHGNQSVGRDNLLDSSSTLVVFANMSGQSFQCRAESFLRNPLNWGPVYTPVFTAPRHVPETYSLRIEYVAGIVTAAIVLTVIIAVIIWKWRSRNRRWVDITSMAYSTRGIDDGSVSGSAEVNQNYCKM